jgi:hypothetical protein
MMLPSGGGTMGMSNGASLGPASPPVPALEVLEVPEVLATPELELLVDWPPWPLDEDVAPVPDAPVPVLTEELHAATTTLAVASGSTRTKAEREARRMQST